MSAARARDILRDAGDLSRFSVVCMPDFFLDHFVEAGDYDAFRSRIDGIHGRGGGNLVGLPQRFAMGGNATNTALALARLGVRVRLVCRTDSFGAGALASALEGSGVDLSGVRDDGTLAVTTALEFRDSDGANRNVMISTSGSVADHGPEDLTADDLAGIREADAVVITNWSQNVRRGTALAAHVARIGHESGALTYFDTGDPTSRSQADIEDLVERVLAADDLDVFALNENELHHLARAVGVVPEDAPRDSARDTLVGMGSALAKHVRATLDVHTANFAASWPRATGRAVDHPAYEVECLRVTGAGDAWNAGNVLGHILGADARDRLALANAVAGFYVSSPDGRHPTAAEVAAFMDGPLVEG